MNEKSHLTKYRQELILISLSFLWHHGFLNKKVLVIKKLPPINFLYEE